MLCLRNIRIKLNWIIELYSYVLHECSKKVFSMHIILFLKQGLSLLNFVIESFIATKLQISVRLERLYIKVKQFTLPQTPP